MWWSTHRKWEGGGFQGLSKRGTASSQSLGWLRIWESTGEADVVELGEVGHGYRSHRVQSFNSLARASGFLLRAEGSIAGLLRRQVRLQCHCCTEISPTVLWSADWKGLVLAVEKAMAPHSSTPAWKNPMDRGAWWAAVHGVAKSGTRLSDFTFTVHFHALEKEMATHPNVLAWRIPGTGEPGGLLSIGVAQSRTRLKRLSSSSSSSSTCRHSSGKDDLLTARSSAFSPLSSSCGAAFMHFLSGILCGLSAVILQSSSVSTSLLFPWVSSWLTPCPQTALALLQ